MPQITDEENDVDPFEDFDELDDYSPSSLSNSSSASTTNLSISSSSSETASTIDRESSRKSLQQFQDEGDDWNVGVDAQDDELFAASSQPAASTAQSSTAYVRSKIQVFCVSCSNASISLLCSVVFYQSLSSHSFPSLFAFLSFISFLFLLSTFFYRYIRCYLVSLSLSKLSSFRSP